MSGVDPDVVPLSCPPDPDDLTLCDDGITGQANGDVPGVGFELDLVRAFLQKDSGNCWTAGREDVSAEDLEVDWIDWGDNLESVDWYTRSQVRTEVVLFQDLATPMLEYQMRHTSGWGINEVHGLAATPASPDVTPTALEGEGNRATVYSHCARLTIQKLLVPRDDTRLADLVWVPGEGWTEPELYEDNLVNSHIFNGSVHEGGDGPGYYSAEINVKGRIIYGYTWNVRTLNDTTPLEGTTTPTPAGDYRLTFSFDAVCGTKALNTFFVDGVTEILVPLETELLAAAEESEGDTDSGGGVAVLDTANNLTYIDVRILERGGGGR